MKQLKLPHRMVMLDHADPEKENIVGTERMQNIVTFSALAEAVLMRKLEVKNQVILIGSDSPTPHSMINDMIAAIGRSPVQRNMREWVEELSVQIPFYKHVRDNLVENGLLFLKKKKILGIPVAGKYSLKDPRIITDYLKLLDDAEPEKDLDIRDLLCMIFLQNTELKNISFLSVDAMKIVDQLHKDDTLQMILETAKKL
jgi:hypothetical protein